jgi:transcriptional regulator with XRE-family HTH domain
MADVLGISLDPAKLREARERAGLTQEAAGELCGVSDRQISHIECGTKQPSSEVLVRMCAAYGVELSAVTTDPEASHPPGVATMAEPAPAL